MSDRSLNLFWAFFSHFHSILHQQPIFFLFEISLTSWLTSSSWRFHHPNDYHHDENCDEDDWFLVWLPFSFWSTSSSHPQDSLTGYFWSRRRRRKWCNHNADGMNVMMKCMWMTGNNRASESAWHKSSWWRESWLILPLCFENVMKERRIIFTFFIIIVIMMSMNNVISLFWRDEDDDEGNSVSWRDEDAPLSHPLFLFDIISRSDCGSRYCFISFLLI